MVTLRVVKYSVSKNIIKTEIGNMGISNVDMEF